MLSYGRDSVIQGKKMVELLLRETKKVGEFITGIS